MRRSQPMASRSSPRFVVGDPTVSYREFGAGIALAGKMTTSDRPICSIFLFLLHLGTTHGLLGVFDSNRFHPRADMSQNCSVGAICVGPNRMYPLGRQLNVLFYSSFIVPELPTLFDVKETCYYDYLNIFWRENPPGGYMNQLVPQLMLGNALANSTNYPDYKPHWLQLRSWHIGAQYFMGVCPDGISKDCKADWVAHAATGKLIPVEPGEIIETVFRLVPYRAKTAWEVSIGVQDQPERTSILLVDKPFMGLLSNTTSTKEGEDWTDDLYDFVYVGSCLENYGMEQPENFPAMWDMTIEVLAPRENSKPWQHGWEVNHFHRCDSWDPPRTKVRSWNISNNGQQVHWTATRERFVETTRR